MSTMQEWRRGIERRGNRSISARRARSGSVAIIVLACNATIVPVTAQSLPDSENGRYTMTPVTDGVLRLDTRTGVMSTCSSNNAGWACYAMPDERAALDAEIGRLQSENTKLKAQLATRDAAPDSKTDEAFPKTDSLKKAEPKASEAERKFEFNLPSDRDIDRVVSFLERAWRRLIEMANRVQRDVSGKI